MMLRMLVWPLVLLATLLVLLATALQTAWMRDLLVHEALDRSVETWSVQQIRGRLFGDLSLTGVHVESGGTSVDADRVTLRLSLPRLTIGRAALETLDVAGLRIELPAPPAAGASPAPSQPFAGFSSPVDVDLDALTVTDARVALGDGSTRRLDRLEARVRLRGTRLDVSQLHLALPEPALELDGDAGVTLTAALPWHADLQLRMASPVPDLLPGTLQARGHLEGDPEALSAQLAVLAPQRLSLKIAHLRFADLDTAASARLDAPMDLAGVRIADGSIRVQGSPDAWRADAGATLASAPAPLDVSTPIAVEAHAHGDRLRLNLDSAQLTGSHGNELRASGSAALTGAHGIDLQLAASGLDVAAWMPGWNSRLDLGASLHADPGSGTLHLAQLDLSGAWHDAAAHLSVQDGTVVRAADGGATVDLPHLEMTVGDNSLKGQLGFDGTLLSGNAQIGAGRLDQLWPGLSGSLQGSLHTRGSARGAQHLDVALHGTDVALAGTRFGRIALEGSLEPVADGRNDLHLVISDTRLPQAPEALGPLGIDARISGTWPLLEVTADGRLPLPVLAGRGDVEDLDAHLRMQLDATAPDRLRIAGLTLAHPSFGQWSLVAAPDASLPVTLGRDAANVRFSAACLQDLPARLCWTDGHIDADGPHAVATLDDAALPQLAVLLPTTVRLTGQANARIELDGAELKATAHAEGAGLSILDGRGEPLFEDRIETLAAHLERRGNRIEGHAEARTPLAGSIAVSGSYRTADAGAPGTDRIDATATLGIEDLSPLRPLLTSLDAATGSLKGELHVSGTLADPAITGSLDLEGAADVPALGIHVAPVHARLAGTGPTGMKLDATLAVSGKPLTVDGTLDWSAPAGLSFRGRATGDTLPLVALPEVSASLSPDIGIDYATGRLRLTGSLAVPKADVEFSTLPNRSTNLSPDVVVHGPDTDAIATGPGIDLDMTVSLGRNVHLKAGKLEATVVGQLALRKQPTGLLSARGRLETTSGGVSSYGESLKLAHGYLSFDGPIDNPAVDVLATRTVGNYEVGLAISGYFSALDTRLHSSPQVDDATALTMLVTGRPPTQTTTADLQQVQSAAIGLGISRAAPLINALAQRIGIDEVGIESPMDEESGAVVVGKDLSKRLHARYTYGIHSRAGGLVLEYRISDSLSVRSEAGTTNAVDLIFRREYD